MSFRVSDSLYVNTGEVSSVEVRKGGIMIIQMKNGKEHREVFTNDAQANRVAHNLSCQADRNRK